MGGGNAIEHRRWMDERDGRFAKRRVGVGGFSGSSEMEQTVQQVQYWGSTAASGLNKGAKRRKKAGDVSQGGYYSINQVLRQYGYPTREEYLFPKPTFVERILNFGVPLDREDLAKKVLETIDNEWDLIHQNLDAVDLDKLKLYRRDLSRLRFKLMTKIENLDKQIAQLRETNWMWGKAAEIRSLTSWKWDITDQLIPVNDEIDQATTAINFKNIK